MIIKHTGKLYSSQFISSSELQFRHVKKYPPFVQSRWAHSLHSDTASIFLLVYYRSLHILDTGRNHHPQWKNRSQTCADVCVFFCRRFSFCFPIARWTFHSFSVILLCRLYHCPLLFCTTCFLHHHFAPLKPNLLPPLGGGRATASYRLVANHLNPAMEEHFATASDWLAKSRQ